jgi:PhnB protein
MTGIAPWLSVRNAAEAIVFYDAAFMAKELERLEDDRGEVVVAQLSVDGADFWVAADAENAPQATGGGSVRMILSVDDPDAMHARALAAGATEVSPVAEDYGWRVGRIADPSGHHWEIGTRLRA